MTGTRKPWPRFVAARISSFGHALNGLAFMVRTEVHARSHAAAVIAVTATGIALRMPAADWIAIILACGLVIAAEALNTAIEHLCDVACPTWNESIGRAKDIAAGAVLVSAIAAALIGIIVVAKNI